MRVREAIRDRIAAGEWKPGDLIPAESKLLDVFAVSRATIRQALLELVREGLLVRKQGRGTFVAPPLVRKMSRFIDSFTQDTEHRGGSPGPQILKVETNVPSLG